jgi:hypothetical protein
VAGRVTYSASFAANDSVLDTRNAFNLEAKKNKSKLVVDGGGRRNSLDVLLF